MSKLKIEDFNGLNVGPFADVVSGVKDIAFLTELEKHEKENGNRKGVLDAINKRQGELVDAPKLGEVDMKVFKETIAGTNDLEKLKSALMIAKQLDKPEAAEMEQIIIERLAEVQKAAVDVKGAGDGTTTSTKAPEKSKKTIPAPPKEDEGITGTAEGDRPATEEEQQVWKEEIGKEQMDKITGSIKKVRLDLDKMVAKIQHHMGIDSTPEHSLLLSKAWLGVCLGELKADSPYKNEEKITNRSQIPATAERDLSHAFKAECVQFNNINTELAVIALRRDLAEVIGFIQDLNQQEVSFEFMVARVQAYVRAQEAKFALGVILGSLKV